MCVCVWGGGGCVRSLINYIAAYVETYNTGFPSFLFFFFFALYVSKSNLLDLITIINK